MKKNKFWQKLIMLTGVACFSLTAVCTPACTLTAKAAAGTETVSPCSDNTEWYFKTENGKVYKRLFHTTACIWLTDWIYVCDVEDI